VFTSSAVPVNGNGTYGRGELYAGSVGKYYWIASYSGDVNNNPVAGTCGAEGEISVVQPPAPTLTITKRITNTTTVIINGIPYSVPDPTTTCRIR